jgi:hypothetical protein
MLLALSGLILLPQTALSGEIKGSIKAQGLRAPANILAIITVYYMILLYRLYN